MGPGLGLGPAETGKALGSTLGLTGGAAPGGRAQPVRRASRRGNSSAWVTRRPLGVARGRAGAQASSPTRAHAPRSGLRSAYLRQAPGEPHHAVREMPSDLLMPYASFRGYGAPLKSGAARQGKGSPGGISSPEDSN